MKITLPFLSILFNLLFIYLPCSTVSSGINAIALVFMADIVQPASVYFKGGPVGEPKATILSKVIGRSQIGHCRLKIMALSAKLHSSGYYIEYIVLNSISELTCC